ncbi:MAG: hypothetical protein HY260_03515, partial [Chloroflexi bacterium]|nr:hypothetical protein [Chloroflexota bacterium]
DGHASTACLVEDGQVRAMASEERFNRIKNYGGPPVKTVDWILKDAQISPECLNAISIVGINEPISGISAYKKGRHQLFPLMTRLLPASVLSSPALTKIYLSAKSRRRRRYETSTEILQKLKREPGDVQPVEHHEAHAYSAYFSSGYQHLPGETLLITADGSGDGLSASISIGRGYHVERIATIHSYHSLGMFYSRVTQYLGMKPLEHEYKVMGLAPYAPDRDRKLAYEALKGYFSLSDDGLSFVNHSRSWGNSMIRKLQQDLFLIRFDGVAAATQQIFEELFMQFILNWIEKTGIHRVAAGGGSFMNVKFNMLLLDRPEVGEIYFLPSCGDESIALGAAYKAYLDAAQAKGVEGRIEPLGPLYFGWQVTENEITAALEKHRGEIQFEKCADIERRTAELMAEGKIIGRVRGRMEWGARALGNRSIVASPDRLEVVRRINTAIKMRDFWMPFAPSILWERRSDYIIDARDYDAPYMIVAFESTPLARKEVIAGLHPSDLTCRPQLVRQEWNPAYHRLLSEFEALTGIGAVLNTSFNLHGDAIVMTAEDAIYTLLNSGLDFVSIEDYLVSRIGR